MVSFIDVYKNKTLLFDGAMGTTIQELGLKEIDVPEKLNLTKSSVLKKIHDNYINAGADVIETNTFGATSARLEAYGLEKKVREINKVAVETAKESAKDSAYVAGSVGPLGKILEPFGELKQTEAKEIFSEQISALVEYKVDLILIETMISLDEALIALNAAKSVGAQVVGVTMTFDVSENGIFTSFGETPADVVKRLCEKNVDFLGANCGHGFDGMEKIAKELRRLTDLPLLIQPNAGLPKIVDGKLIYDESVNNYEKFIEEMLNTEINFIGGCCGTTYQFIQSARKVLDTKNRNK